MAFNGSGTFVRVHDWTDDADAAIDIEASRMDEEDDGFATGLSTCVTKDGQTTITANLPMAGFRHTGVGDASARTHYAKVSQIQDNSYTWIDGGGTADAITATYSPAVTVLVDGMELKVRATAANATTTPTFAPNGLTARTITKQGGSALVAGDIAGDNHELTLRYFLASTRWELLNPALPSNLATISTSFTVASASGPTGLAFFEDTDNGTNKVTLKAPASIAADVDITLPGVASTLATLAGTETLTNKTIAGGSNTISGITEAMQTLADNTTNDVSTSAHGYAPKGDGSTTKFLNANGAYSTPSLIMTPLGVGSTLWASTSTTKAAGATIAAGSLTAKNPILIGASTGTVSTGDSLSGTYQALQTIANTSGEVGQWQRTV